LIADTMEKIAEGRDRFRKGRNLVREGNISAVKKKTSGTGATRQQLGAVREGRDLEGKIKSNAER